MISSGCQYSTGPFTARKPKVPKDAADPPAPDSAQMAPEVAGAGKRRSSKEEETTSPAGLEVLGLRSTGVSFHGVGRS